MTGRQYLVAGTLVAACVAVVAAERRDLTASLGIQFDGVELTTAPVAGVWCSVACPSETATGAHSHHGGAKAPATALTANGCEAHGPTALTATGPRVRSEELMLVLGMTDPPAGVTSSRSPVESSAPAAAESPPSQRSHQILRI